jgi:hypothetical protein
MRTITRSLLTRTTDARKGVCLLEELAGKPTGVLYTVQTQPRIRLAEGHMQH